LTVQATGLVILLELLIIKINYNQEYFTPELIIDNVLKEELWKFGPVWSWIRSGKLLFKLASPFRFLVPMENSVPFFTDPNRC
jgi:hypothetical protein